MHVRVGRHRWLGIIASVALAITVNACGGTQGARSGAGAAAASSVATFAELPNQTPNYILPMFPIQYCFSANTQFLNYFMWRPLYLFGR